MHIILKPIGSTCNNDCLYCFYKENNRFGKIDDELLKIYFIQYIDVCQKLGIESINFCFQGGEPTILGVDFFKKLVEIQRSIPCLLKISNSLQTNGLLLDDEWCKFLKDKNFLVGISIDGPQHIHNSRRGNTFDKVVNAIHLLNTYKINYNAMVCIGSHNENYPLEVYDYLVSVGVKYIQFIPIVHLNSLFSINPEKYGDFLIVVFDRWREHDIGKIFVQDFENFLFFVHGLSPICCIFGNFCSNPIVEYNGDVYSCDHFASSEYKIGNILEKPLDEIINSSEFLDFGARKRNLSIHCMSCQIRNFCNGGCPKNRLSDGTNYLCVGYKKFFFYLKNAWHLN